MEKVYFKPTEQYIEVANTAFDECKEKLQGQLPYTDIQHAGSTAIPGTITKGDLDINVRVPKDYFESTLEILKNDYQINQPENWNNCFASFNNPAEKGIDVGIQVTIIGSESDDFVILRDKMKGDAELVQRYNSLKVNYQDKSMDEYRKAKADFFESLRQ